MLSKINFSYKRGNQNSKKEMILKQIQTKERIELNEKKSINRLHLTDKVVTKKIQNDTLVHTPTDTDNAKTDNAKTVKNYEKPTEIVEMCKLYDGKKFNSQFLNIVGLIESQPMSKEMFLEDENYVVPYNVERIRAKGIKIINNVYQSKYNFGRANCTGLGDFIRGSYFILEFCDEYNFEPKIVFNNYIAKFLRTKTYNLQIIHNVLSGIQIFKNNNFSAYTIINKYIIYLIY